MIGKIKILKIAVLILCFKALINAQQMDKPILVKSGTEYIDCTPPYASPVCIDYDNDGIQDLIVGTFRGKFRFYKNVGTKCKPLYDGFELLQANGEDAIIKNW
jgi:hypothetical protein